jgi:hypothetical protein
MMKAFILKNMTVGSILYFLRKKLIVFVWLLRSVRLYFAAILTVLTSYYVFIRLTPGQDVVMQVGEYSGPFWWTVICVILWTIISRYSSRLIGYAKALREESLIPESFYEHLPRLLAYNALVSIQAAIVALPTLGDFQQWKLWIFVLAQNGLYFMWSDLLKRGNRRVLFLCITALASICYLGFLLLVLRRPQTTHQHWLPYVAFLLFIFQLVAVAIFVGRRMVLDRAAPIRKNEEQQISRLTILRKRTLALPEALKKEEQPFYTAFNILAFAGIVLYVSGFCFLELTDRMGPLAFTLLAFGILVGLSNIITAIGIRRKTNYFVFLFVTAILVGNCYDPYGVRLIKPVQKGFYANRPDLKQYFNQWIDLRDSLISTATSFPVYLIIADGGASRSGYWVGSILADIQDSTIRKSPSDKFSDHLLCLAGASGGSVGTSTFYALLNKQPLDDTFLKRTRAFLRADFLTPVISHWLGSDLIKHLVPLPVGDRAAALEQALEHFAKDSLYDSFEKPLSSILDVTGKLPILFVNTTHVQQGAPAVISSIRLQSFSRRMDVLDSIEKTALTKAKGDIRYSTAVVLGARFPFVSPAGGIGAEDFVDGGYFDNTGAGIVHEMVQYLDSMMKTDPVRRKLYAKIHFKLIHISNSSLKPTTDNPLKPVENDLAAPLLTVLNTYASQTEVSDQRLITFLRRRENGNPYLRINLNTKNDQFEYPMNWVISNFNLKRMDKRVEEYQKLIPKDF